MQINAYIARMNKAYLFADKKLKLMRVLGKVRDVQSQIRKNKNKYFNLEVFEWLKLKLLRLKNDVLEKRLRVVALA